MLSRVSAQVQAQSLAANRVWGAETALPAVAQPAAGSAPPREPADGYLSDGPVPAPKDQLRKARVSCCAHESCTCADALCTPNTKPRI